MYPFITEMNSRLSSGIEAGPYGTLPKFRSSLGLRPDNGPSTRVVFLKVKSAARAVDRIKYLGTLEDHVRKQEVRL